MFPLIPAKFDEKHCKDSLTSQMSYCESILKPDEYDKYKRMIALNKPLDLSYNTLLKSIETFDTNIENLEKYFTNIKNNQDYIELIYKFTLFTRTLVKTKSSSSQYRDEFRIYQEFCDKLTIIVSLEIKARKLRGLLPSDIFRGSSIADKIVAEYNS